MKKNYVYLLACAGTSNNELFYKVGVSNQPYKRCYNISVRSAGKYVAVPIARKYLEGDRYGCTRKESIAYQLERTVINHLRSKGKAYSPQFKFPESSECFALTENEAKEMVQQFDFVMYDTAFPEVITVDSHLIVMTPMGVWKTNKSYMKASNGILGVLAREMAKKKPELTPFYIATKEQLIQSFSGLNLSQPINNYKSQLKKVRCVPNDY
ncbi:TPA: GIY-YIG nuclease family protein [Vibrio parahaemolyticus]|nr:GIY-YIG nuclease family protein [Vibrio parahaemolyticus]MDF5063175.1 GIY-YIG nuclease family protein [Vibrio parahaemolyticus]MDF5197568.1 GIY-YIG nuclease family protein [Vibrio parahaemolyticus]HBC3388073.1 GIY-YIG nuclease family protein [Vibrio parahaemolyticus]